ncbi:hypothetical protein JNL27_09395 [bacterium]|nr:hypothetical protein [bacterium]
MKTRFIILSFLAVAICCRDEQQTNHSIYEEQSGIYQINDSNIVDSKRMNNITYELILDSRIYETGGLITGKIRLINDIDSGVTLYFSSCCRLDGKLKQGDSTYPVFFYDCCQAFTSDSLGPFDTITYDFENFARLIHYDLTPLPVGQYEFSAYLYNHNSPILSTLIELK